MVSKHNISNNTDAITAEARTKNRCNNSSRKL
jgi:hypothetical protein